MGSPIHCLRLLGGTKECAYVYLGAANLLSTEAIFNRQIFSWIFYPFIPGDCYSQHFSPMSSETSLTHWHPHPFCRAMVRVRVIDSLTLACAHIYSLCMVYISGGDVPASVSLLLGSHPNLKYKRAISAELLCSQKDS